MELVLELGMVWGPRLLSPGLVLFSTDENCNAKSLAQTIPGDC